MFISDVGVFKYEERLRSILDFCLIFALANSLLMISHYENPIRPFALVYSVCTLLANRYSLAIYSAAYLGDSASA
jgi:hypothetical protein